MTVFLSRNFSLLNAEIIFIEKSLLSLVVEKLHFIWFPPFLIHPVQRA